MTFKTACLIAVLLRHSEYPPAWPAGNVQNCMYVFKYERLYRLRYYLY